MTVQALDILDVIECPHRVFLNHSGNPALKSSITHFIELLRENGVKHEQAVIEGFEYESLDGEGFAAAAEATRELMRRGVQMIYQGALVRDDMVGRPDLLVRAQGESALGPYFYFPIEIKNASGYEDRERKKRKKKYGLQLAYYARLLEAAQALLPPEGQVIDLDKELVTFPIRDYLAELDSLLPAVGRLVRGEEQDEPALIGECASCQWRLPCRKWLEANDDITLIPGISRSHKEKLLRLGIRRTNDPLSWDRRAVVQLPGVGVKTAEKWERQARVLQSGTPEVLAQRPALPAAQIELFFDVENDPTQDLVYLFGLGVLEKGQAFRYVSAWADGRGDEERAWRKFLTVYDGFRRHSPVVYHYSTHERTMVGKLAERHPSVSAPLVEDLKGRMCDLHRLTVDSVVLPVPGYGLKEMAKYLGFQYTDPDAGGAESIWWYNQYQDDPVANASYKARLLRYNEEDCRAMVEVLRFLRSL